MADNIIAVLSVALPLAFVLLLAWAEFDFKWGRVWLYLLVFAAPALLVVFYNPFANLTDWQLGLFGVLSALAVVGIAHLVDGRKG